MSSMPSLDVIIQASKQLYQLIIKELSKQSIKKFDNNSKTFEQLESWRQSTLPSIIHQRYETNQTAWINKNELILLMDWKLTKGKFRPTLPKLIKSNDDQVVIDTTKAGFKIILDYMNNNKSIDDIQEYKNIVKSALKKVCELRGVGPATGSLILSLLIKINPKLSPPFFSDESFMYLIEPTGGSIKYNVKEYIELLIPKYYELTKGSDVSFDVIERGSWALWMYQHHKKDKLSNVHFPDDITTKEVPEEEVPEEETSEEEDKPKPKRQRRR
ncbi:uncharacterized protein J8A68_000261 [[Candida] subhashii]|uniref:Uncharacterized protein n=1 Tax=[Candida] subhashii TaxID=561895 RepID=A0A8J5QK55_9ASCO|nr:uncharacterized protein J8A68_000261 [[Candida] subhashii]KAG7666201.1 hypothetical protein J8A68_000261 [[Candida] subhashii]